MYRNNEVHYLDRPVAVVSNPHSTGAGGGKKAEEIAEFLGGSLGWHRVDLIETENPADKPLGREHNTALILQKILRSPSAVLFVVGGDGTYNDAANAILQLDGHPQVAAQARPLLTGTPVGNGNDFAETVLFSPKLSSRDSTKRYLMGAYQPYNVDSFSAKVITKDEQFSRFGTNYISVGTSAVAAAALTHESHRQKRRAWPSPLRRVQDGLTIINSMKDVPPIKITVQSDGKKEEHTIDELLITSIPRVGGVFNVGDEFADSGKATLITLSAVESKSFLPADRLGSALQLGSRAVRAITKLLGVSGEPVTNISLTIHDPTILQIDGEPTSLSAGAQVDYQHRPNSLAVLAHR